jgi:ribosomal protein S18 acetylase RimI-like enzyme
VAIRPATPADAAAIAAVHVGTWDGAYRGLLPDEYLDAMDVTSWTGGWERTLTGERPPGAATLVAVAEGGKVVGFVDVVPSRDDGAAADTGEVTSIYVLPPAWGTGAGRALMSVAVDCLCEDGFRSATLWVLRDNERARRFYERAGWSADGASKDDVVAGATVTEVRYRREL